MSSRKKVVITGASGFLGSHLVERIKDDERYEVYALSSRPDELRGKIGGASVEYLWKDAAIGVRSKELLENAVIISCAYPRNSTGIAIADGLTYIQKILVSAVENKAAAIINISSQSVYSQQRTEIATEETAICLESPYAVGKYAVELMLESICKGTETNYTNLRMASLIGPGFDQRIVNRFVKQAYAGEPLHVVLNDQHFGFLDIEDAISAILALIDKEDILWQPTYAVGNGKKYSIKEIADSVERVFGEVGLDFSGMNIDQDDKSGNTAVDYQQISIDTGFKPVENTVHRILATFKS